ncbi:MAG: PD40 domain-containing protein [Saprospiraceae bacterium]|nr:PD40 domain-containing protein [Saprospiraceae bacterium]
MKHIRLPLLLIFFAAFIIQKADGQVHLKKEAIKMLANAKYKEVVSIVNGMESEQEDGELLTLRGISYYFLNKPDFAIRDLRKAHSLGSSNPYIFLYSAKSYYAQGNYEDAALFYKNYLKSIESNHEDVPYIVNEIKRCAANAQFQSDLSMAYVENLGGSVNSEYDEKLPKHSPNHQNKYYFSSDRDLSAGGLRDAEGMKDEMYGRYTMDMYSVELINGNWTPVYTFNSLQNTAKNEYIQGFNGDGNTLYFLKSTGPNSSELYADSFNLDIEKRAFPKAVVSGFDGSIGDKDLFLFNDSIWLFSSMRAGGFGGYDLYFMRKVDGNWEPPQNLGPTINSNYNDVSPFLSKGSKVLTFSSDRLDGFGGYDVFVSGYNVEKSLWENPRNLGSPVNSPMDELGFFVSADGSQAVLSSNRINGFGGFDIYIAYLKTQLLDQLEYVEVPLWLDIPVEDLAEADPFGDVGDIKTPEDQPQTTEEAKEFLNQPILLSENDDQINATGQYNLNNLADLMKINPEINVVFLSSTSTVGMADFNLFYTVKRGEQVVDYLAKKGINKNRMTTIGKGDHFPLVNPGESRIAATLNNRIDIKVFDYNASRVRVFDDPPTVLSTLIDERSVNFNKNFSTLFYAVKIAETSQMLRTDLIKTAKEAFIVKSPNKDFYEYYVGLFDQYNAARGMKNDLLRQNVMNAEVVPFLYGRKLDATSIQNNLTAFPDLEDYLKYEK